MNRVLACALAVAVLLFAAPPALANQGPPPKLDPPQNLSPAIAAIAGAAGAVLAGYWFSRRVKP
jgi:hypothetical protein